MTARSLCGVRTPTRFSVLGDFSMGRARHATGSVSIWF